MRRPHRASLAFLACAGLLGLGASSAQAATVACPATGSLDKGDDTLKNAELGFSANFYGTRSSIIAVRNNGNLSFRATGEVGGTYDFARNSEPIIGPFLADIVTSDAAGAVTYGQTTFDGQPAFCATWAGVLPYRDPASMAPAPAPNTFQALLVKRGDTGDFDIVFNYDAIGWAVWDQAPGGTAPTSQLRAIAGWSAGDGAAANFNVLRGFDNPPETLLDTNTPGDAGGRGAGLKYDSVNFRPDGTSVAGSEPGRYIFEIRNPAGGPGTGTTQSTPGTPTAPSPSGAGGSGTPTKALARLGRLRLNGRTLSVPVTCGSSARGGCRGTVTARVGRQRVASGSLRRVAAGRTATTRLRLTARGRRLLRPGRTVSVRVSVAVRDNAGRRRTLTSTLRVRTSRR